MKRGNYTFTMKTKKGISHVEIILSFVIFISFVTFLLILLNPIKSFSRNTSYLSMTESKVLEHISTNLTVSSLKLNSTFSANPGECFYFEFSLPNKIIIKDEDSFTTNASKSGEYFYFKYNGKKFYKIYSSEEFEEKNFDITSCTKLEESNYTIGLTNFYKKVSYSKLINLNQSYNENYEQLKQALGLKNDFNIAVNSSVFLFKAEKFKPKVAEVMAKDIPMQILDENANLNPAIMNIQVWD